MEEHFLKLFENRMMRIYGPKKEVTGDWRKLHGEDFRNLFCNVTWRDEKSIRS